MDLFDRFLQERTYLKNVSPETLRYYQCMRQAFSPILSEPTKEKMLDNIQRLLAGGLSPTSVNTYLRGFKAYIRWLHEEGHLDKVFKVQFLKTEQKVLSTFSPEQIQRLIHWKPVARNDTRVHLAAAVALDGGLRITELLGLRRADVDLDNLLLRVKGKGNKHRLVPMSIELRKLLYRYLSKHSFDRLFATSKGTQLSQRNAGRDFKVLCGKIGITGVRCSFHTLRHSFAVNYLRAGGNLYYLQRILGHTSITTTERYLRSPGIADLQKVHDGLSLLTTNKISCTITTCDI